MEANVDLLHTYILKHVSHKNQHVSHIPNNVLQVKGHHVFDVLKFQLLDVHVSESQVSKNQVLEVQVLKVHVLNIQVLDKDYVLENFGSIQVDETTKGPQELRRR